jgi:hypothetical protein
MHARVDERLLHPLAVDGDRCLVGVLLDDREQVREQPPLGLGQLSPGAGRSVAARGGRSLGDPVDREAGPDQGRGCGIRGRAAPGGPQALLGRSFALLRYRWPSSYRRAYAR